MLDEGVSNKYDIIVLPVDFLSKSFRSSSFVPSYFTQKGQRVFCFTVSSSEEWEVISISKNFNRVTLTYGKWQNMANQMDNVVRDSNIKECIVYAESPMWQPFIKYLKEKFNFKVILNYSERYEDSDLDIMGFDDNIFRISDEIITANGPIYRRLYRNNFNVSFIGGSSVSYYIESAVKSLYGLVSIVIVTFNNLEYTKKCINSIIDKTAYPNYEIIIVDNNSQDGTPTYLEELQRQYSFISVILNDENYGFAKANNIGIKKAKGSYLILLNNDTVVTRGWIGGLVKHLERDEKLAIVGPVTNSVGNEAKINIEYDSIEQMDDTAEQYTFPNANKLYEEINMLAFFCVAMRKEIIDEIGYLDEGFGVGMFEDDDFCNRVREHGYKIACAEDVFVHHYGGTSFKNMESQEYRDLFVKNRQIYEQKWKTHWVPHKYRDNLDIVTNHKNVDIMFFSIIDWSYRYQRPQHIASYFAKAGYRVFYFNVGFKGTTSITEKEHNLEIITLDNKLGHFVYFTDFSLDMDYMSEVLDEMIKQKNIKNCIMFSEYPNWYPLNEYLMKKYKFKLIVDYLDEYTGFRTVNNITLKNNDIFLKNNDLVIASSRYLGEQAKRKGSKVELIRNGTEFNHFSKAAEDNRIRKKERPVIGYYGAIAEWFDVEKIEYAASKRPEWDIVLIGDVTTRNAEKLRTFSNVTFTGEKDYAELPDFLKTFDVCIIPFKTDTDLVKATNPVKFYEYLSAAKSIVATEIPELMEYKDKFVYLTNDKDKFVHYIEMCLQDNDGLASAEEKLSFAASQDWSLRCKRIEKLMSQLLND